MVWIIAMIIGTISTFTFIKYITICVCEGHLKSKSMEHCIIPSVPEVIFCLWGFWYPFVKASFGVFHSTRVFASLYSPSKNLDTCPCVTYTISINTSFAPPHASLEESTPNLGLKKRFYEALDLNWLWFKNLTHVQL